MSAARRFTDRALLSLLAAAWFGSTAAFEAGAPPAMTGGFGESDCTACHFDNAANAADGEFALTGVPEIFEPGRRYALTVSLNHPQLVAGGFQLSVRTADGKPAGDIAANDNDVGTITLATTGVTYVQHKQPRVTTGEGIHWTVTWRAPDEDVAVVVNVAANAANYDASPFGDHVFTVSAGTAASETTAARLRSAGNADPEAAAAPPAQDGHEP